MFRTQEPIKELAGHSDLRALGTILKNENVTPQ